MNILVFVSHCLCSQAMNTVKLIKIYLLVRKMNFKGGSRTINYVIKWGVQLPQLGSVVIYSGSQYQFL